LEGRLDVGGYNGPGYYLENDKLREVEQEAMLEGNATLREYEDKLKLEERDKMSLKEWKNNELNGLLMKKFGILKESKDDDGLTAGQKKLPKALQDKIKNKKGKVDNTENTKFYKGKKSDSDDDDAPKGGAPAAAEEKEAGLEETVRGDRKENELNADGQHSAVGGKSDRFKKVNEDLDEGQLCEKCGGKHKLEEEEELDEGGLADRAENAAQAAAGRKEGGRFKRMQESIRRTLKENKKIRLRIRK
jgi:flagellin-like hook-associated protein FlgL